MSVEELEAKLAAVKAERAAKAAEREEATRAKRLADQIAREEQAAKDDEKFAELLEEHGEGFITRVNTRFGMVVVKAADPMVHRRFCDEMGRADHPNPKVRTSMHDAAEKMVRHCLVYPDKAAFDELARKVSGLIGVAANEAYELGKPQVEEDAGK